MSGRSDSRSETPRSSENQADEDKQEVRAKVRESREFSNDLSGTCVRGTRTGCAFIYLFVPVTHIL